MRSIVCGREAGPTQPVFATAERCLDLCTHRGSDDNESSPAIRYLSSAGAPTGNRAAKVNCAGSHPTRGRNRSLGSTREPQPKNPVALCVRERPETNRTGQVSEARCP
ncbi:hypothetical protein RJ55_04678 [Drechmeria coniospora]|nr:hypothetical protein RJ55_04678 [Drechmeria coniospora]